MTDDTKFDAAAVERLRDGYELHRRCCAFLYAPSLYDCDCDGPAQFTALLTALEKARKGRDSHQRVAITAMARLDDAATALGMLEVAIRDSHEIEWTPAMERATEAAHSARRAASPATGED